jgi:hypothetical protein
LIFPSAIAPEVRFLDRLRLPAVQSEFGLPIIVWEKAECLSVVFALFSFFFFFVLPLSPSVFTARYFWLHGIWNMLITGVVLPGSIYSLMGKDYFCFLFSFMFFCFFGLDPVGAMDASDSTHWPVVMVLALHVWHCVAYSNLTYDDYFHHIVFTLSLGVM